MLKLNILFVGGGNITEAIVSGLTLNGYNPKRLFVIDRNIDKCERLRDKYQIHADPSMDSGITADVIFLAVKPQGAREACSMVEEKLRIVNPIIISVMAGITTHSLGKWLGEHLAIIRAAPNTPALIQAGVTGLFANTKVSLEQKTNTEALMSAIGVVAWLTYESHMDIVTALSGSGPAYYFYFMECLQKAAVEMGMPVEVAHLLTLQTAYGAAKLATESAEDFEHLRAKVTSKAGTTAAALKVMLQREFDETVRAAMEAARQRSIELSQALDSTVESPSHRLLMSRL